MLVVDPREGSGKLVAPLQAKGLEVVESKLEFGDVAFEGKGERGASVQVGIEVKKLNELVQAMRSGRLEGHQLLGMREALPGQSPLYDFAYLFIEGEVLYDDRGILLERKYRRGRPLLEPMHGQMNVFEFKKRLHVLHLRGGLNVQYAKDQATLVDDLEVLYRVWTDKALDAHTSHLAIYNAPPLKPISQFRMTAKTLPGLGFNRTAFAQRKFKSIRRMANATVDEWATLEIEDRNGSIKRLGQSAAESVVRAITEEHS